jgi:glycosyltransferase involved in cell wall biosynthesis
MVHPKISFIIPTVNRVEDLRSTLDSFLELSVFPNEILIVDQSDTDDTKQLYAHAKYKVLHIRYFHTAVKSSALARNIAIDNLSVDSNIVVFLDDDVTLNADFLEKITVFFQNHSHAL